MSPHEAFAYALEEIKECDPGGVPGPAAEIKLWRESK